VVNSTLTEMSPETATLSQSKQALPVVVDTATSQLKVTPFFKPVNTASQTVQVNCLESGGTDNVHSDPTHRCTRVKFKTSDKSI